MSNNDGSKDPWGQPQGQEPDIFAMLKKLFAKKAGDGGEDEPNYFFRYLFIVLGLILVIWAVAGIYVVSPAEEAVVLRFGKYVATQGAGPHWIPQFIESRYILDVQQVRNFPYESEMLTKDENIVKISLAIQFRIANPRDYLFNVVSPVQTLQEATSSALRQVVGNMTLDTILTTGRAQLRQMVSEELNNILKVYQTGLAVTDVNLQTAKPPEQVTAAFDDAIKAREDEQRYINQAKAYQRRVLSIVAGKVSRLIQSAEAYQKEVVLQAKGATARYDALLTPYEKAPTVTRERLYLDTVSNVLSHTHNVVIDSNGNNVMYLPLDQILRQQLPKMPKNTDTHPQTHSSNNNNTNTNTTAQLPAPSGGAHVKFSYGEQRPSYTNQGGNS